MRFYIMLDNGKFLNNIKLDNTIPSGIFGTFEEAAVFNDEEIAKEILRIVAYKLLNKVSIVTIEFNQVESRISGKLIKTQ